MDALAGGEAAFAAWPAHRGGRARGQVHLHPRFGGVEQSQVAPAAHVEVAAQQAVQVLQQVQVEGRGDPQVVVVGGFQQRRGLDRVDADQQRAAAGHRARLAQQPQRVGRRKVADARPRVEHQRRAFDHIGRQLQPGRKIQPQAQQVDCRVLALQLVERLAQKVDRDVHRHVAPRRQRAEQPRRLGAIARAQVDQHRLRAGGGQRRGGDRRAMGLEDGGLGARGVVLGRFGDGVEQPRAERVVEELGRGLRRLRHQAEGGFAGQGAVVGLVQLDESRRLHNGRRMDHIGQRPWAGARTLPA